MADDSYEAEMGFARITFPRSALSNQTVVDAIADEIDVPRESIRELMGDDPVCRSSDSLSLASAEAYVLSVNHKPSGLVQVFRTNACDGRMHRIEGTLGNAGVAYDAFRGESQGWQPALIWYRPHIGVAKAVVVSAQGELMIPSDQVEALCASAQANDWTATRVLNELKDLMPAQDWRRYPITRYA